MIIMMKEEIPLEKVEMNHKFRQMYAENNEFDENIVKKNNKELYDAVMEKYGDWERALKLHGVTKKRRKEQKKFMLYEMFLRREEKFGDEALRPKNIEESLKEEIVDAYGTLKNLRRSLKHWGEDKIMFELRAYLLSGNTIEDLGEKNVKLLREIKENFGGIEEAKDEYLNRFVIKKYKGDLLPSPFANYETRDEEEEMETPSNVTPFVRPGSSKGQEKGAKTIDTPVAQDNNQQLLAMLENLGYLTKEQATDVNKATHKTPEEIRNFLLNELIQSQQAGSPISPATIKEKDHAMYIAIVGEHGTLEHAIQDLATSLIAK